MKLILIFFSLQDDQWRERIHEELLRKMAENPKLLTDKNPSCDCWKFPVFQGHSVEAFLWAHSGLLGWGTVEAEITSSKPMPTSSNLCQVAVIGHSLGLSIMFDLMQKAPGSHLYLSYLAEMASNAVASRGWNDFHMACIALLRRCGWHILELASRCCLSQQQSPRFFNETWSTWNVQDSSTSSPKKDHGVRSCQACPCGYSWEHGSKRDQDSQGLWFCQACVQNIWGIQGTRHFMYRLLVSYPDHLFAKMDFKAIQISISSLGQPWPTPLRDCYLLPPCQFFQPSRRGSLGQGQHYLFGQSRCKRLFGAKAKATTSGFSPLPVGDDPHWRAYGWL